MNPFVKWAGGKKQLCNALIERMPKQFSNYYEPFVGGGALLLTLAPKNALINDINEQLVNVYNQLKTSTDTVIELIKQFDSTPCDKDRYYSLRERYNGKIVRKELDAECAALFIWINKHCFNGLYRVNSKGLFNVPYNNKVSGDSIDEQNIRDIGEYLSNNNIVIQNGDFETACSSVKENDFVYFDSPYIPISQTASFVDYSKDGFGKEEHLRLANLFKELDKRGAFVMLSNNDVDLVHELYEGYNIESIDVRRAINSNAQNRKSREVIIRNYA